MSARSDGRIGSDELKARVEEYIGAAVYPAMFARAEDYARRKLDLANEREGRRYGEDGYGDDYLVLLMADTIRELAFSDYTFAMYDAMVAAQEAQGATQEGVTRRGEGEKVDDPGSESDSIANAARSPCRSVCAGRR